MASEKNKKPPPPPSLSSAPPPPPRTLSVHQFAESRARELAALHETLSARLGGDFRAGRRKRRRTTGYRTAHNRLQKRRKVGDGQQEECGSRGAEEGGTKKVPRRIRRRRELQSNAESGFCVTRDGTRRLRTHLWHAKRFTMVKRWGFYLPLGLHGRGRGSRAVLKWLKSGAVVHDASYCSPIQLEGPEDSLLAVLRMVLLPSPSSISEELPHPVTHGVCYENAMLYHVGTPFSRFIAPVTYMWRPFLRDKGHNNAEMDHVPDGCSTSDKTECSTSRQLWLWIHAGAFKEGFNALRSACQMQTHRTGASVSCFSLEGGIAKLEVMGSKAIQVLQKILRPISEPCDFSHQPLLRCSYLKSCTDSRLKKSIILDHMEQLPPHAILSLTVHDPRDLPSKETEPHPSAPSSRLNNDMEERNIEDASASIAEVLKNDEDIVLSLWSKPGSKGNFLSDSQSLWDCCNKPNRPIDENTLCTEKHLRRLKYFYLDPTNDGSPASEAKEDYNKFCSILLVRHSNLENLITRWSIILPLSWVKVFWIPLVSHDAHAVGLREMQWIACNNKLPTFPMDFPDCETYSLFMADEADASNKAAELRPPAVRPLRVPIPPIWDCIMHSVKKGPSIVGAFRTLSTQQSGEATPVCSLLTSDPADFSSQLEQAASLFQGFIPRTSKSLSEYLEKKCDRQLLLFPNAAMEERGFCDLVDERRLSWMSRCVGLMPPDRELCFVRVLLHAFREGAFEEGAVVCAPVQTDLSLWASRSEKPESLQIPQTFIKSYFTLQDSGNWELKIPEDLLTLQSYRWPIGFITSGFVHGSSKPVAVALCEAKLLSLLRRQQWSQMGKERPEIFVLVRNLRSASYRRALATIVLEQQNADVEFM